MVQWFLMFIVCGSWSLHEIKLDTWAKYPFTHMKSSDGYLFCKPLFPWLHTLPPSCWGNTVSSVSHGWLAHQCISVFPPPFYNPYRTKASFLFMLLLSLNNISKWERMVAAAQPNCPLIVLSVTKQKSQSGAFILWLQQLM